MKKMFDLCKKVVFIFAILLYTSSCATIFKGSSADIRVNSSPAGATVTVNGVHRGLTPQTLSLKRNKDHILEFTRDGYEKVTFAVDRKFDIGTTIVGNLFSWWLLGVIVDVASGAAYTLTPADLNANLSALQAHKIVPYEANINKDEVFVFMLTHDEWKAIVESNK